MQLSQLFALAQTAQFAILQFAKMHLSPEYPAAQVLQTVVFKHILH